MLEIIKTSETREDTYTEIGYSIQVDGKDIGAASAMIDSSSSYVDRIDIDEEYRGRGYGTKALRLLSQEHGGIAVAPDNEDARRLYDRIGTEQRQASYDDWGWAIDQGFGVYDI